MIVLRCLRPDWLIIAVTEFIEEWMKKEFTEVIPPKL